MKFIVLIYLLFFYLNLSAQLLHAKDINKIVAKIDNELITSYDIKNKILTTLVLANKEINQKNIDILKKKSLDDLVQNRLKKIELKNHDFKKDTQRINTYLNSISSNNIDELKLKFKKYNINFQDFENEIDIEFKWRNLIYNYYSNKIEINQSDIDKEAEKLIRKSKNLVKYNLSEIEILINNDDQDYEKISQVQNVVQNSSFEEAVLKFSIASTSSNNGKMGWIDSSSLSNDFLGILNKMKIGEVSKPIKKQDKVIFLKLNDKKISNNTGDNIEIIKNELIERKKNELFMLYSSSFLSKLRNTKFIEYYK